MSDVESNSAVRGGTAGLIAGVSEVTVEISFATLIFSGALSQFSATGIGFALTGALVISVTTALVSSYPGTVAVPQDAPAVILAQVAAGVSASLAGSASPEVMFVTVTAALVLSTLLTGISFLGLGWLRAGRLVRYVPYPVIGGFLAGTGWLLLTGAIDVMTETELTAAHLSGLLAPASVLKWGPGLVLGAILLYGLRRWDHYLVTPAVLVGSVVLFYSLVLPFGYSVGSLQADGFLLGPFTEGVMWTPVLFESFAEIRWDAILQHLGSMGAVVVVSAISLLLNAGGIELEADRDLDFDHELRTAGLSNVLAGWTACPAGYHALSSTALGPRLGAHHRSTGLVVGLCCGAFLLGGRPILSLFPNFVLGGILVFLGLSFLYSWLYEAWFELQPFEYGIILVILLVIATFGFLEGVGLGLLVSIIMFTVKYGNIDVVRARMDGSQIQSNVDRPPDQQTYLREEGERILVLRLQGFIFFGTSHLLLQNVKDRVNAPDKPPVDFVIFGFDRVPGLDSSAKLSFLKLLRLAQSESFELVFADMNESVQASLVGYLKAEQAPGPGSYSIYPDLDRAMEYCEDRLLASADVDAVTSRSVEAYIEAQFPDRADPTKLAGYFETQAVEVGDVLIEQGADPGGMYFIEGGHAEVRLQTVEEGIVRLRTMHPGAFVGEVGLYLNAERSASVVMTEPGTVALLSRDALTRMEREHPEAAIAFHRHMVRMLSERLQHTNEVLKNPLH